MSHGYNANIKGVDNINSHENSDVNVIYLFNTKQRINRSYDRKNDRRPIPISCTQIHFGITFVPPSFL